MVKKDIYLKLMVLSQRSFQPLLHFSSRAGVQRSFNEEDLLVADIWRPSALLQIKEDSRTLALGSNLGKPSSSCIGTIE